MPEKAFSVFTGVPSILEFYLKYEQILKCLLWAERGKPAKQSSVNQSCLPADCVLPKGNQLSFPLG